MQNEPLITVASLTALGAAVLAVVVAAGIPVSPELQTAILGLLAVASPFVVAYFARKRVSPTR